MKEKWWHVDDSETYGMKQSTILRIRLAALLGIVLCIVALFFLLGQLKKNIKEGHALQPTTFMHSGHRFRVEYEKREGELPLAIITHDTACEGKEALPADGINLPPHR
jgi:hypothetical protein